MKINDGIWRVVLLAALIAVALSASLYGARFTISDTDPSTYVIIPLLMLPLFALFFAKGGIAAKVGKKDIAAGLLVFAALVVATAFLHVSLSYLFASYGVDMLLFPLFISSMVLLIFGLKNLRRFWPLIAYSVFASPALLIPVMMLNQWFASINTQVVYHLLGVFTTGAVYAAPITILANGYRIGIGESCVGIGLLIAMAMLLIPVAYLYSGRLNRKVLWIASGIALLFVYNLMRMFAIAASWVTSGPTSALSILHAFAGMLLFYAAIIIMVLISPFYSIGIRPSNKGPEKRNKKAKSGRYGSISLVAAILLSAAYLMLNISSGSAANVSAYLLTTQQPSPNAAAIMHIEGRLSNTTYLYGVPINSSASSFTMLMYNKTNTSISISSPILVYASYTESSGISAALNKSKTLDKLSFISSTGSLEEVYYAISNSTPFIFYRSEVPYGTNASYSIITFYAIVPAADMASAKCISRDGVYSTIFNDLSLRFYNSSVADEMANGECVIGGAISNAV